MRQATNKTSERRSLISRSRSPAAGIARLAAAVDLPLEPYQRRIVTAFYGPEREFVVLLPKGNAKTTLAALVAVHHLLTARRPYVVLGAASREQARVCFEAARDVCEHPALEGLVTPRHLELRVPGGVLRVVASDGGLAHGPTPSLSVVDELWAHKNAELYEAARSALVKRADARLLVISTPARSLDTPLGRVRTRALAGHVTRRALVTDARAPGVRLLEWGLGEGDDLESDDLVKRVNPASWISAETLAEQRLALPRPVFLQLHAGVWGAGEGAWLPPGAWTACLDAYALEAGERVWAGVDIGGSRASTAVVAVTEDLRVAAVEVFEGDDAVLRVPDAIRELGRVFAIEEVAFDPWRFQGEALRLEREDGLRMVEFPQSHSRMTVASEGLHRAIIERRLRHRGERALDAQVAQAVAKQTGRGWRIDTADRNARDDAVVALAMAVERAEYREPPAQLLGWI